MPVRPLPSHPNLDHLKHQAKDLLREHRARTREVAQQMREFHPRFGRATDGEVFDAEIKLSDAQLTIAREHGFPSWARMKAHIERPTLRDQLNLPHHERIEDATFRRAVDLLDSGDVAGLRAHLERNPKVVHQHVRFEGGNYFRNPTLLEFVAENPVRHGKLPGNIVEVAETIIETEVDQTALDEALMLVSTGSVARECGVQAALIDVLCDHGADASSAIHTAAVLGELAAVKALMRRGARMDLPVAAALGRLEDANQLLPRASSEDRHLALALAAQFGYVEIVRRLLDASENPDRYNPVGGHSHATPLHQAAGAGHSEVVQLLVERGARLDMKDILWRATPADWARHEGKTEIEEYLRGKMRDEKQR